MQYTIGLGIVGTVAFLGIAKMLFFDDEFGDPNRPEIIERYEKMEAEGDTHVDSDGNWGKDKRDEW